MKEQSFIFKEHELTPYHRAINDASLKFCLEDPTLISDRGRIITLARQQVHVDGYQYKKKSSRSKTFGDAARSTDTDSGVSEPKKPRWSQEMRQKRLTEIEEDIQGLKAQLRLLEKSREKYSTTNQYERAAEKCKEITSIREKKRWLQSEVAQLQKLGVKSKNYHREKTHKCKDHKQRPKANQASSECFPRNL